MLHRCPSREERSTSSSCLRDGALDLPCCGRDVLLQAEPSDDLLERRIVARRRHRLRLRLTGGEPLVRRDVMRLFRSLGRHLVSGSLDELTLTTNGTQLSRYADEL